MLMYLQHKYDSPSPAVPAEKCRPPGRRLGLSQLADYAGLPTRAFCQLPDSNTGLPLVREVMLLYQQNEAVLPLQGAQDEN